ncbi:MAG: hypothetical protein ABI743_11760, partial [bacterium]
MHNASWWFAGSLALVALGCSGGQGTDTITPSATPGGESFRPAASGFAGSVNAELGQPVLQQDLAQSALAIYTIDVDTATLSATSHLRQTRSAAANDDLYLLPIDSFLKPSSFLVTGVSGDANNVNITYTMTHPFPACSTPDGTPNGSTNRADLGVAGMVLILADVPAAAGNTFFTDRVANTDLVVNADAYYSPGGLLTATGGNANTFPYKTIVDEVTDNRTGVSNGGDVTGNFGADSWTRTELGTNHDGWTGMGIWHQGQTAKNSIA